MATLVDSLETITQRTGAAFDLTNPEARNRFLIALQHDFAGVIDQLNNVYHPIVDGLSQAVIEDGLSGNTVYTDPTATVGSATAYYDITLERPRTIKETIDVLLTDIAAIQNSVTILLTQIVVE